MSKLQRYSSYKESGVEWVGEIPEHWEVSKLGTCLKPSSIKNRADLPLLSVTREQGVILRDTENKEENHNFIPDDLSGYKLVVKGQFAMNKMKAWQGSFGISSYTGIVSPAYYIFELNGIEPDFFHKAIRSKTYIPFFIQASDGVRIGQWDLSKTRMKEIPFYIPPKSEQTAIVSFLDTKTAQIDQAIRQKEQLIELLKERRQIVINDAVTKGVVSRHSELDSESKTLNQVQGDSRELKESGVEWIGEIPKHWEVSKVKNIFKFNKGLTITKENLSEEGVFCVNYGEIHSKYGFEVNPEVHDLKCVNSSYLQSDKNSLLYDGDFVFADTSEDIEGSGNFTYLNSSIPTFAGYHTIICRPKSDIVSRFFAYEFDSIAFRTQIQKRVKGVKVYSITQSLLKDMIVWIPPKQEQLQIVAYIDEQTAKIDRAIELQQNYIAKLKEYKATLIDSVVTGKVKIA